MQTFLPYADFARSARVLDDRRLGKQRIEAWQIWRSLTEWQYGWENHPAVLMWRAHEPVLLLYGDAICAEWQRRGFKDSMRERFARAWNGLVPLARQRALQGDLNPPWLGDAAFHRSHRSNLLRKHPSHYRRFWPRLRDDLPCIWPAGQGASHAEAHQS